MSGTPRFCSLVILLLSSGPACTSAPDDSRSIKTETSNDTGTATEAGASITASNTASNETRSDVESRSTNVDPGNQASTGQVTTSNVPVRSDSTLQTETTDPTPVIPTTGSPYTNASASTSAATSTSPETFDEYVARLRAGFIVYWDFESADGTSVLDTNTGAPLVLDGATREGGPSGQHVAFWGATTAATAHDIELDTSRSLSLSAWVKLDELGDFNTFVGKDGAQVSALFLQKRSNDRLSFATFPTDDTAATPCVTTAEIQPRQTEWYFVVATRDADSGEQRLYVDGVLSGKSVCTGGVFQADGPLSVGRGLYDAQQSDWMTGALDELGVIQRVLTPDEISALYRASRPEANHYLFAYFVEVSQGRGDGLRLAHSHDGLHWGAIGAGKVFMPPSVGGGSFRDPHLMRDPEGLYHLVWTTTCVPWAESNCVQDRGMGHATSPNLVDWSDADYITIALDVEHVWAPETFYDDVSAQFIVFWSSPLDLNPATSDPHDIYYILTKDFQTFTEPKILYSRPNRNFIDATIKAMADGNYLMILKDEADGQKNLRALRSATLFGPDAWTADPSAPLSGNYAAEGPSLLERSGELYTYFDKYGEGAYGALRATTTSNLDQPSAWQDISSSVFFPGVRHGTPIEVPWEVFERVARAAAE